MNGNFKTLITIAATPLLLLSCSDEVKLATESEGENLVSLTVQLPEELGTRAFGEASKIKSLKYAVYPQGEQQPLAMFDGKAAETVEMTGLSKNVQLQLASGKKYDVIFWAAADEVGAQPSFLRTAISVLNSNSAQISPETENLLPGTRHSADGCRDGATVISRIAHSTAVIYGIHTPAAMAAACSRTANLAATPQPPTTAGFRQLLTEMTAKATDSMTTTTLCHA